MWSATVFHAKRWRTAWWSAAFRGSGSRSPGSPSVGDFPAVSIARSFGPNTDSRRESLWSWGLPGACQGVFVCGRDHGLADRLTRDADDRIQIMGYGEPVEELMALADVLVTKAGAV